MMIFAHYTFLCQSSIMHKSGTSGEYEGAAEMHDDLCALHYTDFRGWPMKTCNTSDTSSSQVGYNIFEERERRERRVRRLIKEVGDEAGSVLGQFMDAAELND